MAETLTRFILEVRKLDGSEYPANSLHHIIAGLQRYLRTVGYQVDIFKDEDFAGFHSSLDAEMKRIQGLGIGTRVRKAEIITIEEEELLWEKGLLGDKTAQSLLDTIIFLCGLFFALRSGKEYCQLRRSPCQIRLVEREGQRAYLEYTEDLSKNHLGGLKGRKIAPKVVRHHDNPCDPSRCFVRLYKLYMSLCPADAPDHTFYLKPLDPSKQSNTCWYSKRALGHNTLDKTVSRLCSAAGIGGFKTNHSLRATTTSRLYQSGVEEQQVMERTGHRSLDGVRSYKRTSDNQRQALSDILNRQPPPPVASVTATRSGPSSAANAQGVLSGVFNLQSACFTGCNVTFYGASTPEQPRKKRWAIIYDSDSD